MSILSLKTKMTHHNGGLGVTGILMSDGITLISVNSLYLKSVLNESIFGSVSISTIDGSTLNNYSYTVIKSSELPVTISSETLSSSEDTVTITYSPTVIQRESVILRLNLNIDTSPIAFDIYCDLVSIANSNALIVTSDVTDFGDIDPNDTASGTITLVCSDPLFNINYLSVGISSLTGTKDSKNFSVDFKNRAGTISTGLTLPLIFTPKYTVSSNVKIQFYYNQSPIGDPLTISGSKGTLVIPSDPTGVDAPSGDIDSLIAYRNNTSLTFRISSLNLVEDPLGEFAITNPDLVADALLHPSEVMYVPLTYSPKQAKYSLPKLELQGVYF